MRKILVYCAVAVGLLVIAPRLSSAVQREDPFSWTNGYSLIVTSDVTLDQSDATVDFITDNGGQVAIVVSPRILLGWANGSLVGKHGIVAVFTRPVPPGLLRNMSVDETDHLNFFNQVSSGKWRADKAPMYGPMQWSRPDTIQRPGTNMDESLAPKSSVQSYPGTSDFMVGKVKYNVFFVESNGAIDPNTYSWTCADMTTTVSEIAAGLSFWSSKGVTYGVPLSFATTYYRPPATGCTGNNRVLQPYEPITHPGGGGGSDGDGLWVNPIMCNFGYCSGDKWTRVEAFNAASRLSAKTNWATSMFMVYNPAPAPTTFTNGYFGYSWVPNGPFAQLLFRANGWAITDIDRITSHETGHLFGADDEYAASGCSNCATSDASSKNVVNGNCVNCNTASAACMMRQNESVLCGYTPGQLGWGLNYTALKTSANTSGTPEKTNWVPGQIAYYVFTINMPGKAGECINVRSRWYRQFQDNLTESEAFDQTCLLTTGGTRTMFLQRAIPAGAAPGEALVEVQLEFYYSSGYYYGRGIRANTRGRFFVLPTSANPIATAPVANSEPGVLPY